MSRSSVEYEYRKLKANQEPLMPGIAYAGAAAVGGAIIVNRVPSIGVKIFTPLALAAVTGSYFLPAHTDLIKGAFYIPLRVSKSGTADSASDSLKDLKRSVDGATFDLGHKTITAVDDVSRQAQTSWDDIRHKAEKLADSYKDAGQEQVNKVVEKSVQEAKYWLDQQKAEADRILNETASAVTTATAAAAAKASSSLPSDHFNRFHNNTSQAAKESAFYSSSEKPSSSRWSWWSKSDSVAPKLELEKKVRDTAGANSSSSTRVGRRPSVSASSTPVSADNKGPRKVLVVDKSIATTAVKGHDNTVNRAALMGKNAEETAHKVYNNVIDAALPKERQSRNEIHQISVARRASESGLKDGQYRVREVRSGEEAEAERVGGKLRAIKKDLAHGLENIEKRAHMLYDGVEYLEQSINKRVEKSLQEEADFWHEQSLKDQQATNTRGGDRAM
ncbi:hypothetical protein BGZ83_011919 [Gryganskiella cystojenkinii]|nr:hypothetical protein BGZ83_011919 [Gryganskiella cystojenkinii]